MKNIFLILLIILVFSCEGTPEAAVHLTDYPEDTTSREESEYPVQADDPELKEENEQPAEEEPDKVQDLPNEGEFISEPASELPVTEDSDVEERLSSIEDALSNIEDRLASILEALLSPPPPPPAPPPSLPAPLPVPPPPLPPASPPPLPPSPPPPLPAPPPPAVMEEPQIPLDEPQRELPPPLSVLLEEPPMPSLTVVIPQDDDVIFSRTVRMTVGQVLEIPFRGTGWVYLGELASRRGIVFSSRRNDPEGMTFIFNTEEPGTYMLRFFRRDFVRDVIVNDHVQVIVGEAPSAASGWFNPTTDRGRVTAEPRWPSALDEAAIHRGNYPGTRVESESPSQTAGNFADSVDPSDRDLTEQTPFDWSMANDVIISGIQSLPLPPSHENNLPEQVNPAERRPEIVLMTPDELLQRAGDSFAGGNVAAAISFLDQYRFFFPSGTDELYWLYGQFYEANSPSRNILLALDYYRRLTQEFPQSSRFNEARRRIAYLERFYLNIR